MPIRFAQFELDPDRYHLTANGRAVRLERIPLKLLFFLAESRGVLVSRQAIAEHLWGDGVFVDSQHSVNTAINKLRTALRDDQANPRFIQTVIGMGYRFVAEVEFSADAPGPPETPVADDPAPSSGWEETGAAALATAPDLEENHTVLSPAEADRSTGAPPVNTSRAPFIGKRTGFGFALLLCTVAAAAAIHFYRTRQSNRLTDKDTIVLAGFANGTDNPVFDQTLDTALSVSLRQSPFLDLVADSEFAQTLKLMERKPDDKLTPEATRELCQRVGSKAYVTGSIVSLGSHYVLSLRALNCRSGELLAEEQETASSKERVLDALDKAASNLRAKLGESLGTVQKFDLPLERITTPSLEALKALSMGTIASRRESTMAALPWYLRAVELDPNLAMGYKVLGDDYYGMGEIDRASQYLTRAFELRQRTSGREELQIAADYYRIVTGELDKAEQAIDEEIESYPRETSYYEDLISLLAQQGKYEKAAEMTQKALRAAPDREAYIDLADFMLALGRLQDARTYAREAEGLKGGADYPLHESLYAIGFLTGDSGQMAQQQQWFASSGQFEDFGLALAADSEAYAGRLGRARELTRQAVDAAERADSGEDGAIWEAVAAQREAAFGNAARARGMAVDALRIAPRSRGAESEAALALAMAGDAGKAESVARDLEKRFPVDTQIHSLWLPAIEAQAALASSNPSAALAALRSASPLESGQILFALNISCLYPVYVRGEADLADGQSAAAAGEFQKILDHSGIVWNCWTGPMAQLGVARANAAEATKLQGAAADAAHTRAVAAYKEFLALWKNADPDIPILKTAELEYAKLR